MVAVIDMNQDVEHNNIESLAVPRLAWYEQYSPSLTLKAQQLSISLTESRRINRVQSFCECITSLVYIP